MDADALAEVAAQLAGRVREESAEANAKWLTEQIPDPADWFRLAFVLAAAVPDGRPWLHLTAWTRSTMSVRADVVSRDVSRSDSPQSVHPSTKDRLDEIAIERACHGDAVALSAAERVVAVDKLTRRGLSRFEIAERLRVTDRTVSRARAKRSAS